MRGLGGSRCAHLGRYDSIVHAIFRIPSGIEHGGGGPVLGRTRCQRFTDFAAVGGPFAVTRAVCSGHFLAIAELIHAIDATRFRATDTTTKPVTVEPRFGFVNTADDARKLFQQ